MKLSGLAAVIFAFPLAVAAEQIGPRNHFARAATGIASANDPAAEAEDVLARFVLSTANSELNSLSSSLLGERLKYLSLSLGYNNEKIHLEGMSVYGLHETKNMFVFNQTSLGNYDGRNTLNFGLGVRHINDNDTVIIGLNAFQDYEFGSDHRRASIGAEVLTSLLQVRSNYYRAISGEKNYGGLNETALDGHDIKLTYELPYFYDSDVYYRSSHWYDGSGYRSSKDEIGVTAEVASNLLVKLAGSRTDAGEIDASASITYRIALGAKPDTRAKRDGVFRFALEPVRDMLYQPVQRENRIVKKSVSLGITVSGV
jgi:hypothetical protein